MIDISMVPELWDPAGELSKVSKNSSKTGIVTRLLTSKVNIDAAGQFSLELHPHEKFTHNEETTEGASPLDGLPLHITTTTGRFFTARFNLPNSGSLTRPGDLLTGIRTAQVYLAQLSRLKWTRRSTLSIGEMPRAGIASEAAIAATTNCSGLDPHSP